ncbi:hypothetical protein MASR1M32_12310 [Rhodobacter sp.]
MGSNDHVAKPKAGALHLDRRVGKGWFVVDEFGARQSGPYTSEDRALMALDGHLRRANAAAKRGPRPCMCCGREFASEGIHHRLCNSCRHRDAGDDPLRPYIRRKAA